MPPPFEVEIEKLVYGGEGLGRVEGRAVLVPLVAPGEKVLVRAVKEEPRLVRARLEQILAPSAGRTEPGCPYFGTCGGCQYQHLTYAAQLSAKSAILRETLRRIGKLEAPEPGVLPSEPWNYRNRARFKTEKHGGNFRLGYFELGSHRLLAIERCPISSPRINALIAQLYELALRPDFPEGAGEIEVVVNHEDNALLLTVTSERAWPETLVSAARETIPGLESVANTSAAGRAPRIFGRAHILYRAGGFDYRVSHGAFFQTNRCLVERMAQAAVEGLEGETVLDLFSGVGYFALPLARKFRRVLAVESNAAAIRDLDSNRSRAALPNIEVVHVATEEYLEQRVGKRLQPSGVRAKEKGRPDAVLLDPPRAGVGKNGAQLLAATGAPVIVYVSCDPSTLARDVAALVGHGYRLESLKLVDLFPQTFHIETVATMCR